MVPRANTIDQARHRDIDAPHQPHPSLPLIFCPLGPGTYPIVCRRGSPTEHWPSSWAFRDRRGRRSVAGSGLAAADCSLNLGNCMSSQLSKARHVMSRHSSSGRADAAANDYTARLILRLPAVLLHLATYMHTGGARRCKMRGSHTPSQDKIFRPQASALACQRSG